MENVAAFDTNDMGTLPPKLADPIISTEYVKWAARRFILIYGEEAPEMALKQVTRLDGLGKIRIAEMFDRVRRECARLLKRSENLRIYPVN
ncbi:hypothetical protein [Sneathiella sp. HT1-7]|uniref:hypothetical protein n=1 Tax=Sneathiella sp. HT1-7 TaxID=2887192 RepID=UPI001D14858E|nr:hypothetical protein [Sneathiella sp. HT1-7]MCC3303733.1 hypothetical protein [Sneathiella sp. HT1-7]